MNTVHLVISELFLPLHTAELAGSGLVLSALERLLARAECVPLQYTSLESWLCSAFGVNNQAIAPITLAADGYETGSSYWLRADPVHLYFQRNQLILNAEAGLSLEESQQLCFSLNEYFVGEGLHFIAPHPQRWYLRLDQQSELLTCPVAEVAGKNVQHHLPQGEEALRWHKIVNEIQMIFYEHNVNKDREMRGELTVNSVWLWGGGCKSAKLTRPCDKILGDSELAFAFAASAAIPYDTLQDNTWDEMPERSVLVITEGLRSALQCGDGTAWRERLQQFECCCVEPLLKRLHTGKIKQITLDTLQENASHRFILTRTANWKFWQPSKPLASYARE